MSEEWRAQFRELMRQGEIESARQEAQRAIDKAKKPKTPTRWLTPDELRRAAAEWVEGRNRISDSSRRLREEHGILVSDKMEYISPDYLDEPMHSAVLALMVERGEWPTEPGTNVPMYKRTPTINYALKLNGSKCSLIHASKVLTS